MTVRVPKRRVGHIAKGRPYYLEDSWRGVLMFVARLFPWIDLDCHVTKDGVLVITHWPKPLRHGFRDPLKLLKPDTTIEEMTWAEVKRLRTRFLRYRISRADRLVVRALRRRINVELEPKTSAITTIQLRHLRLAVINAGLDPKRIQVKAFPKFLPALEHAHEARFVTIALTHTGQNRVPKAAAAWLDYYRGLPPHWT